MFNIKKVLKSNSFITFLYRKLKSLVGHISPELNSRMNYYMTFGRKLNMDSPAEFNEKLMYLKLNNYINNPKVWRCSDKYTVRLYAKEKGISDNNLIKLYGVYKNANEINFENLPDRFVLKCSHGCGFNYIVENKVQLDVMECTKTLNKWLKKKFGYEGSELQYTKIKPVIMCEELIEKQIGELPYDYKVYCFHGVPKMVLVCSDRGKFTKLNWFDLEWNELLVGKPELRNTKKIMKPSHLDKMIEMATILSYDFPFVRVDFYEYDDRVMLGEMTFTPAANCAQYYSDDGNKYISSLLDLKKED